MPPPPGQTGMFKKIFFPKNGNYNKFESWHTDEIISRFRLQQFEIIYSSTEAKQPRQQKILNSCPVLSFLNTNVKKLHFKLLSVSTLKHNYFLHWFFFLIFAGFRFNFIRLFSEKLSFQAKCTETRLVKYHFPFWLFCFPTTNIYSCGIHFVILQQHCHIRIKHCNLI